MSLLLALTYTFDTTFTIMTQKCSYRQCWRNDVHFWVPASVYGAVYLFDVFSENSTLSLTCKCASTDFDSMKCMDGSCVAAANLFLGHCVNEGWYVPYEAV